MKPVNVSRHKRVGHPAPRPESQLVPQNAGEVMVRPFMSRCVLIAGLFIACNHAASARQITNGDFEGGTYTQMFGTSTDVLPNGWTNSPPTAMRNLNVFANGSGPGSAQSGT